MERILMNLMGFLERTELKGKEVPQYIECAELINNLLKEEEAKKLSKELEKTDKKL